MTARETWVRPPVVATEAPSVRVARWRYRALAVGLLVVVLGAFVWLFLKFSDVTGGEDPGIGLGRPAPAVATSA